MGGDPHNLIDSTARMSRRDVRLDVEAKHSLAVMGSFELTDTMLESPRSRARTRTTSTEKRNWYTSRVLGTLGVASIIYLLGCGGPIGSEVIIYAGGPLIGLIAITVYPLVMTAPYGYIVAELCAAFPQDGGFAVWTMHAFGPFWGFQVGCWMWISGILNLAGTNDVVTSGDVDIDWAMLVNTLAWKFGGLTMASLFAGEVKNPAKVFPRAIGLMIALSFVSVFVPQVAAIATYAVPWPKFDEQDALKKVGSHVGGGFLSALVIFAGATMSFGRFVTGLYCTSFQLSGMAEYDMLPHFLANKKNRFRSPQIAVLCTLVPILPALLLKFRHLLRVGNVFACAVELFVFATAVKLRLSMPYVPRPVKMPGGIFTLVLAMLGPATVVGYILYDSLLEAHTRAIVLIALVPGLIHGLWKVWTERKAAKVENPVVFNLSSSLSSSREIATPRFNSSCMTVHDGAGAVFDHFFDRAIQQMARCDVGREKDAFAGIDQFWGHDTVVLQETSLESRMVLSKKSHEYSSRVLGTACVIAILYLFGCAGPIGAGRIVFAGGPLVGLIAIAAYPLVMALPYGYIIAELCSAFPQDGGVTVWVMHAFGPLWGFQVGYWVWVSGVLTCAFVPELLLQLIEYSSGYSFQTGAVTYFVKVAIAVVLSVPSFGGTIFTSRVSVLLLTIAVLTFSIFIVWAFAVTKTTADFSQVRRNYTNATDSSSEVITTGDVDIAWVMLINTLAWKFGGLHVVSLFAGEVKDPARVFSRAICGTIGLTLATLFVALLAALASNRVPWSQLDRLGIFIELGDIIGGTALSPIVVVSELATMVGRYITSLYCASFQLSGMAEAEMLPVALANKKNRFRSPQCAVLATLVPVLPLLLVRLEYLLQVSNLFTCAVQLAILVTAIKLRMAMPYIPRSVKMPGGIVMLMTSTITPAVVLCYMLYDSLLHLHTGGLGLTLVLLGVVHSLVQIYKLRKASARAALEAAVAIATPQQMPL
uniref:Amino acid permease/ SLC12A domain-containing protein n=1 Tax=Globisporangium ultimum (strain ATCC 200006 / CBS 805.95 / DAOM BR144) TaxID=431595 RepID=K3WXM1_GLOUD